MNLFIQYLNNEILADRVCSAVTWDLVQRYYCPEHWRVMVGIVLGVGVGFVVKFVLDKFVVFKRMQVNLRETSREFATYLAFSLFTTVVINFGGEYLLWGVLGLHYIAAAAISLTIGYTVKYFLDRKYVFKAWEASHAPQ